LGRRPLKFWAFVADISNEFILGLDILRAHDASVDIGRLTLRLAGEEISLWSPGEDKDHVMTAKREGIMMVRSKIAAEGAEPQEVTSQPQTSEELNGEMMLGCSGRNSLKEGAVWRISPVRDG
jgi:hypothetical protein